MIAALVLLSIALLCAAGAVELWWNVAARQRQQAAARSTEARLAPQQATTAATPAAQRTLAPPPSTLRALLWRADLREGPLVPLAVLGGGALVALLVGMRMQSLAFALLALVLYALACTLWLRRRIEHKRMRLLRQLPDFLENMVRLAATGNSLGMAFQSATQQVVPPLRPLLDHALLYTRGGMDLDRALQQAARPYRLSELETLAVVLGTSLRIGGRSDQILQRMSDFLRDTEQVQQELMATTSETRMSAWVIGLLPPTCALMMALFSPDFFRPMLDQPLGQKLLLMSLLLEAGGAFALYRLAKSL